MGRKAFEVWTEGFQDMGQGITHAKRHGTFSGETFKDAVIAFRNSLDDKHSISCIDIDNMVFWGCSFFDNELDARERFG